MKAIRMQGVLNMNLWNILSHIFGCSVLLKIKFMLPATVREGAFGLSIL
uniref:Uncharacterized protein n=1 Tax=Anguilla anguilla TaxID=7936 RepID=A0A0E9T328_ANGAN